MSEAREQILARIRQATTGAGAGSTAGSVGVPRDYRQQAGYSTQQLRELLTDRLVDYRARVLTCAADDASVAATLESVMQELGVRSVVAPARVVQAWLAALADGQQTQVVVDDPSLTATDLDEVDAVVTGAALAIAETGVVVLDGGPWCGRRVISLVPDLHVCVVRLDQVVGLPPEAMGRLDPRAPQTWIAGPSATSDIELDRVEGVHGPRTLVVVLAG